MDEIDNEVSSHRPVSAARGRRGTVHDDTQTPDDAALLAEIAELNSRLEMLRKRQTARFAAQARTGWSRDRIGDYWGISGVAVTWRLQKRLGSAGEGAS